MIFDLFDYILGTLKMALYKCVYTSNLKITSVIGKYSRTAQIRLFGNGKLEIGKDFSMRSGVKIRVNAGKIKIGNRVGFNNNSMINCMSKISIGNNVIFGQSVKIYDHDHDHKKEGIIRDNGYISKPIVINDNVWIGSNCIILKGTVIGENTVIGANTVVFGNIPANSIIYSNRDMIVKKRGV